MHSVLEAGGLRLLPNHPQRPQGGPLSVRSVDLGAAQAAGLPVFVFDEFRVSGHPFGPHPHAGFSAVTSVLEDSAGGLRSRDSLGNDIVVGAGGMVWTQAGRGVQHEELPATPGHELHGLQVFVKLPAAYKLTPPCVLHLDGGDVPEWRGPAGDRVRVLVGEFGGQLSPLQPDPPFRWLDLALRSMLDVLLEPGHRMLAYTLQGEALLRHAGQELRLPAGRAALLAGAPSPLQLQALGPCRLVLLSGAAILEPAAH